MDVMHNPVTRFLTSLQAGADIPLRLQLWNGMHHDLGSQPRVTVNVPGPAALRYFLPPSLDNLAEGYVNGHFDVDGLAADIVAAATGLAQVGVGVPGQGKLGRLFSPLSHDQAKDAHAIEHHYDVSNDFYRLWLDEAMVYSCAYFPTRTESLEQAQINKLDHILNKLMLKPCERVAQAGLGNQVEIRLQDYRDVSARDGQFDKITSIGMFEHVGLNHLEAYFDKINALLKDGGLVLNHGITSTDPDSGVTPLGAAGFIEKYVFPNGELPHISLALKALQSGGLEALDVECLRRHYARTLACWSENYEQHIEAIHALVSETTYRVWRIYLAGCAHAFEQNWVSLHQVLACKAGTCEALNPTPWSRAYMYA